MSKAIMVAAGEHDMAQAHMALRQQDRKVVVSADRRFSLVADGATAETAIEGQNNAPERWSYYVQFPSNHDGLDDLVAFVNWCGTRNIETTRVVSENTRNHGIVGWIDDAALAVEFRNRWM